ncbi:hypothetical protein cypCar_00005658 [Cyprinus carpio]|nr:hypothetical protein cypCar_00005658 [Cyprinus carpio]
MQCKTRPFDSFMQLKNGSLYAFRGDQYYQYEFKHQPSHEECIQMSLRSPSALFRRYTNIYYDRWVEHFNQLFGGDMYYRVNLRTKRVDYANSPYPRPIGKYWLGCKDKPGAEKR